MNYFIVFMLVIVMCFELKQACPSNTVIFSNGLTPHRILNIHCHVGKNYNTMMDLKFGENKNFTFIEKQKRYTRMIIKCLFRDGSRSKNVQVYRGAKGPRCYQTRVWVARSDGIYFMKNNIRPLAHALDW
ncbi:hypothetical protein EUTSA_v10002725mg [Eutrema salsugineum]|uniref:Uncharacterized protein n=1 Tax=Eutrema salsugineum TaxID=72664 RepID=V4KHX1_EUTSA|nr:hypothetical protein EUTSA_v10002725mg [Eutrema salsugineum]